MIPANLPYLFLGCQGPDFLFFNTKDISPTVKDLVDGVLRRLRLHRELQAGSLKARPAAGPRRAGGVRRGDERRRHVVLDAHRAARSSSPTCSRSSTGSRRRCSRRSRMGLGVQPLRPRLAPISRRRAQGRQAGRLLGPRSRAPTPPTSGGGSTRCTTARPASSRSGCSRRRRPDSPLHLYAIGYLTHVSADTVGHPYVNAISRRPVPLARAAPQGERELSGRLQLPRRPRARDWNRSAIHALYNFNFTGPIDTENDVPDPFTNLPTALATLITDALNEIYDEDGARTDARTTRSGSPPLTSTTRTDSGTAGSRARPTPARCRRRCPTR